MDENSSKFVDKLVMEKILNEKLSKVHHFPKTSEVLGNGQLYKRFGQIPKLARFIRHESNYWLLDSPYKDDFIENSTIPVIISQAENHKANIILVHGLFEENRNMYSDLIKNLNHFGYTVYQNTLPFHFERTPKESAFSGEFFWSANIARTRVAFEQAVYELHQLYQSIKSISVGAVSILSFSMGAGIALSLLSLTKDIGKMFLMNPVCSLSEIVWDSPLCRTIKEDLLSVGLSMADIEKAYSHFEPAILLRDKHIEEQVAIGYGLYDQITSSDKYQGLIDTCGLTKVNVYKSGHLNILRVPKLASDIHNFICTDQVAK